MGSFNAGKVTVGLLVMFATANSALPQASTAIVRGTVRDQVQAVVPGANVVLTNTATNVSRRASTNEAGLYVFPGAFPGPCRVQDWNVTFEKEVMPETVARVGYIGNYGDHQQQAVRFNDATPAYVWYATNKTALPTGEFSSVATRPYDQQAYGDITVYTPLAYGHYNGVQFELERRFNKGFGYQLLWNVGNSIWIGRDNVDVPGSDTVPSINVFNHPNNPLSIADSGILSTRNSGSNARVTQLGMRFTW